MEETTLARRTGRKLKQADKSKTSISFCGQCKRLLWRQLFLRLWRTAELLSLLTANFERSISSSVKQIVLLFFVQRKKIINQAFEFAPNLLQSVSKQTHSTRMSIGNYAGLGVCLYIFPPERRKKQRFLQYRSKFTTIQ